MKKFWGRYPKKDSCSQDVFCCIGFKNKEYIPIRQTKASGQKQSL